MRDYPDEVRNEESRKVDINMFLRKQKADIISRTFLKFYYYNNINKTINTIIIYILQNTLNVYFPTFLLIYFHIHASYVKLLNNV